MDNSLASGQLDQVHAGGINCKHRSGSMAHLTIRCAFEGTSRRYSGALLGLVGKLQRKEFGRQCGCEMCSETSFNSQ